MSNMDWFIFTGIMAFGGAWAFLLSGKVKCSNSYFVSDKRTSLFALVATLVMTELNTSTLVGFASMGYLYGPTASLLACVFLVGLLFYAITVAKKWKQFDGVSITTFFKERYNPSIGYLSAIILIVAMLGFSANFLKSLTLIFTPLFPSLSPWTLSAIFCALMLLVTLRGGLKSIIRIDILSFLIVLVLFPALTWYSSAQGSEPHLLEFSQSEFPHHLALSLGVITMFTYILAPWYGQKIFSARSQSTAFKAVAISAVLVSGIYALAILSAHHVARDATATLQHPQEAIPYVIGNYLPPLLQGVAYGTLFLIAMTTLVGLWNTIASVFVSHHSKSAETKPLKLSVLCTAVVALVTFFGANLFVDQILEKLILCNIPIASLAFTLLAGFYWKRATPAASISSIAAGTLGGVACYIYFGEAEYIWYWALYVIPHHFLVGIIVSYLRPKKLSKQPTADLQASPSN